MKDRTMETDEVQWAEIAFFLICFKSELLLQYMMAGSWQ